MPKYPHPFTIYFSLSSIKQSSFVISFTATLTRELVQWIMFTRRCWKVFTCTWLIYPYSFCCSCRWWLRARPPLRPASRALSLPFWKWPVDAWPPLEAISCYKVNQIVWAIIMIVLFLDVRVMERACFCGSMLWKPPEWLAWPPFAAMLSTSSWERFAKFPGLFERLDIVE